MKGKMLKYKKHKKYKSTKKITSSLDTALLSCLIHKYMDIVFMEEKTRVNDTDTIVVKG